MRFDLLNPTLWLFTTITLGLTVVTLLSIHNAWTWQQTVAGASLVYTFWYLLIRPLLFSLLQRRYSALLSEPPGGDEVKRANDENERVSRQNYDAFLKEEAEYRARLEREER